MSKPPMQDAARSQRYWPHALLFLVVAAMLMAIQWSTNAHKVLHEMGDFGANSLLILDAKRLHLLTGNYSRIGVNHPGPAILYVLAAGEALFHDLLHLAPSPFSGQLLAVCLYSAAWIVLIFAMMRRFTGDTAPALLFATVFAAAMGYFDPQVFLGPWFPDLYILPFAAMLVAISRLAFGRTDALRALAVASGFLINGHVSFIPMLGVTLIVMLAVNWLLTRREPERRVLSRAFLARHRREILAALGILFLFFVPLLILTVTEFPGPLHDYAKFGGHNKPNTLHDALKFVGQYWTPGHAYVWGALVALLLAFGRPRAQAAQGLRDARALGIACIAASLAVLVYAKFGIDHLEMVYIALFYYAVPSLAGALLVLLLCQSMRQAPRTWIAVLASGAALVFIGWSALKPNYYDSNYDIQGSAQLYERLRTLPGTGRIVLDLEQKPGDWDVLWGEAVALQLYARRQGDDLFCINEHWQILFTRKGRCRPEELNNPRRFTVRPLQGTTMVDAEPDFEGQGLLLYRHGRAVDPVVYDSVANDKDRIRPLLGKGWSDIEPEFVWSTGPVAELNLPADPKRGRKLHLVLGSFIPDKSFTQHVDAFVNGAPAGSWDFDNAQARRQIKLDLGADPGAAQHIALNIAHPVSPSQYGSPDQRLLGVSLYGIK